MKSFIQNITLFSFGLIILNILFYIFIFKPALFERYIYNEPLNNYNTFLLSDSHGAYLEETPSSYKIFNFSNDSENYLDMFLKVKYLSKKLTPKDTILIAIDNHNLSSYRNGYGRIDENIIYANNFNNIEPAAIKSRHYLNKYIKYLPLLQPIHNNKLVRFFKYLLSLSVNEKTYADIINKEEKIKNRYKDQFENKTQSKQQKKYLTEIINLCKKKKITLIGLRYPITKSYYDLIKDEDFGIKKHWSSYNLQIIDLHDLFFDCDECFKDQDHLNKYGGDLFCKEIKQILFTKNK